MTDASLVDARPVLGALSAPQVPEWVRDRAMRCDEYHGHTCTLDAEVVAWARGEPTGGFVRCAGGVEDGSTASCGRMAFVPPESCLERIEPDAAHLIVDLSR